MSRIDKYLWAIRVFKTRSLATSEIKKNKVLVNNQIAKPSSTVKINDLIQVKKDGITYSYKILDLIERRVGAKLVSNYVLNITTEEELEKKKQLEILHQSYRESLVEGKPSKKDKRDLRKFLGE
ncbi:MAG: RNA-binding S4 domain-containing protein [Crocinitomicaceae bacterium]|nr:RNA-binding S4 domain-containing protein [Crocinitomicaceae bacterium]